MLIFQPLESSDLFGFIAGLPMHPLVVHAAVVLLPLSALVLVVLVFVPSWRTRFGWATIAGLAAGTGAAFVAKESGEALAERVGLPADHAHWGDILVPVSVALLVVALAWLVLRNRADRTSGTSLVATMAGGLAVVLALAATAITVLVGHSGAQAVWAGGVGDSPTPSTSVSVADPTASASRTASGKPTTSAPAALTMALVKKHASASSCWSVVDGEVFDLTKWIDRHPGGAGRILDMCGQDGSAAFHGQHGSSVRANRILNGYALGKLG